MCVIYIDQMFYDNEFKEFDIGLKYIPHMTIGKFVDDAFSTIVKKVSVEMIGDNEEFIIIIERELD